MKCIRVFAIFILSVYASASFAVLGGAPTPAPTSPTINPKLQARISVDPRYTDHLQQNQFTFVHEYADSNNNVFAVTWRGTLKPDLPKMLGTKFQLYATGLTKKLASGKIRTRHLKVLSIHEENLVISQKANGAAGRAYLIDGVPAGIVPEDLP